MDRIGTDKLIWEWKDIDFQTFGLALQYYEYAMAGLMSGFKVHDFSYAQVVDLACKCYVPHGHDEKLTSEILGAMGWQTYITVKKKLYQELPWQEIYNQSIFASEKLGSSIPNDTSESPAEK